MAWKVSVVCTDGGQNRTWHISGQLCKRTHFSARESGRRMDMDGPISPILETKAERTEFPCTLCRNWMLWP